MPLSSIKIIFIYCQSFSSPSFEAWCSRISPWRFLYNDHSTGQHMAAASSWLRAFNKARTIKMTILSHNWCSLVANAQQGNGNWNGNYLKYNQYLPSWERSTRRSTDDRIIMKELAKSIHYHLQGAPLCFSCSGESNVWLFDYEQMFFPDSISCCSNLNVNVSHKSIWWHHHHHYHVFFIKLKLPDERYLPRLLDLVRGRSGLLQIKWVDHIFP